MVSHTSNILQHDIVFVLTQTHTFGLRKRKPTNALLRPIMLSAAIKNEKSTQFFRLQNCEVDGSLRSETMLRIAQCRQLETSR